MKNKILSGLAIAGIAVSSIGISAAPASAAYGRIYDCHTTYYSNYWRTTWCKMELSFPGSYVWKKVYSGPNW